MRETSYDKQAKKQKFSTIVYEKKYELKVNTINYAHKLQITNYKIQHQQRDTAAEKLVHSWLIVKPDPSCI